MRRPVVTDRAGNATREGLDRARDDVVGTAIAAHGHRHALMLPSPLTENHDLHEQLEDIHGLVGEAFYYIIGLHIVGALWHHFVRHDSTLRRIA